MKLCTARQMAEIDRRAIESFHIPSLTLMENAGRALFEEMHAGAQTVAAVFVKAGKNGGMTQIWSFYSFILWYELFFVQR